MPDIRSRASVAGKEHAKSIVGIVNLMYQNNTANNFLRGLVTALAREQKRRGETMSTMIPVYTREKPKAVGHYFMRHIDKVEKGIIMEINDAGRIWKGERLLGKLTDTDRDMYEFAGPIPEPMED